MPEGGPVTYPFFGGEGAAEFLAPFLSEDVCVGGAASLDASETEQQFVQIDEEEASPMRASAPTANVDAPPKETARWVSSKVPLVRDGGDCGPDTAAWLLKHHGPPVHREGPFTTREGIRQALQQEWKRVIADDPSFDECRNFVSERIDQVPEARGQSCLEAQSAAVLHALLRQESDHPAAEDHGQLAAAPPLPYWFITSDWPQLSKFLQVDFVIHGMPGTENRPCHHCGTNGHVHMGPRDPGTDMSLHLHWRGAGQGSADGAAWGHWEPLVKDSPLFMAADVCVGMGGVQDQGNVEDVQDLGGGGAGAPDLQQDQVVMDAALAEQIQWDEQNGTAGKCPAPDNGVWHSQAFVRSDEDMKELLRTLDPPHFVHESKTHGQHNCLVDSILLALQASDFVRPLAVTERAAICRSIRMHLIEHHHVAPQASNGTHSFLSHEEHFSAICDHLRKEHADAWLTGVDFAQLSISVVVFDRFQRGQLFDSHGAWEGELADINDPVISAPQSRPTDEVLIQLYCNTLDDGHGTPYHYEWISSRPERAAEIVESEGFDTDMEGDNPAPPVPLLPLCTHFVLLV